VNIQRVKRVGKQASERGIVVEDKGCGSLRDKGTRHITGTFPRIPAGIETPNAVKLSPSRHSLKCRCRTRCTSREWGAWQIVT
jgi:hypothetical protein